MSKNKALRTVTDRFSLVDSNRKHTPQNGRNYIVSAVRATIDSPEVKERIGLGEMFGYYGHTNRALYHRETGSLDLPESCTVTIDGQKVVLYNVPSNRTLDISVDDDGVVTHTQEILDTEPGRIVDGMERSMAGGWSWATTGPTQDGVSFMRGFSGVDYVATPNYVSLNRSPAMLESVTDVEQWRLDCLANAGYATDSARNLLAHMDLMKRDDLMLESAYKAPVFESQILMLQGQLMHMQKAMSEQVAMLESANAIKDRREDLLKSAQRLLPVFMTDKQRKALLQMATPDDLQEVCAMFECITGGGLNTLPLGRKESHLPAPPSSKVNQSGPSLAIVPFGMNLL